MIQPRPLQVLAELIKRKASEVAETSFPVMYEEELQREISQEVYHGRMQPLPNSELQQVKQPLYISQLKLILYVLIGCSLLTSVWSVVALF